jgi:tryptophan synthase beta subunit
MNRHNSIMGAQVAVDSARKAVEAEAMRLAAAMVEHIDKSDFTTDDTINQILRPYRKAEEAYAEALDLLADALRS